MKSTTQRRKKWDETYRTKHPDRIRESSKKFRERNVEKERARGRAKYWRYKRENPGIFKKYYEKYKGTPKACFKGYKNGAKIRGIKFELTIEEFIGYWQGECRYCGGKIETIGIDRVDNKKGYQAGNIVRCCRICNHMKRDRTVYDFVAQCVRVARKHKA